MRAPDAVANDPLIMSAIEAHLQQQLGRDFSAQGVIVEAARVIRAEAEDWEYGIRAHGREFVVGYDPRRALRCREVTPGRERDLATNDAPTVHSTKAAYESGLRLIVAALAAPTWAPRDPPVL